MGFVFGYSLTGAIIEYKRRIKWVILTQLEN
jgi:hypothetical protein